MNVNSTHFEHEANLVGWSRARDLMASAGAGAVKAVAENHLSRLDSQIDDEHTARGWRLSFCNATAPTAEASVRTPYCTFFARLKSSLTGEATKRRNTCSRRPTTSAHESSTHSDHPMKHRCPLCNASRAGLGSFDAPAGWGRWDPEHFVGYRLHQHLNRQVAPSVTIQRRIEIELQPEGTL